MNLRALVQELAPEVNASFDSLDQELKVAIVGFGKMGILHSTIVNMLIPGAVKAIVDRSFVITIGVSRLIKNVRSFCDLDKMLQQIKPDVVYVTTPTISHYPIVLKLLEVGVKGIFVEKPPTVNSDQLMDLIEKKNDSQIVMVGFQKRFALPFRHARKLLLEGVIGDIEYVRAYIRSGDVLSPTKRFKRLGRGVLLDLGVHLVDLLEQLIGIEHVEGARYRSVYTGVDDFFEAKLRSRKDVIIEIEVTWFDPLYRLPETFIEVHGSNGVLKVTEDYLRVELKEKHPSIGSRLELYKPHYYQGIPPINVADPEFTLENIHFIQCLRSSTEPLTSLENVRNTMKLIDELYEHGGLGNG